MPFSLHTVARGLLPGCGTPSGLCSESPAILCLCLQSAAAPEDVTWLEPSPPDSEHCERRTDLVAGHLDMSLVSAVSGFSGRDHPSCRHSPPLPLASPPPWDLPAARAPAFYSRHSVPPADSQDPLPFLSPEGGMPPTQGSLGPKPPATPCWPTSQMPGREPVCTKSGCELTDSRPMSASGCMRFGHRAAGPGHTCPVGLRLTWADPTRACQPRCTGPGQEVPRTTQPGNLGEQSHVHRERPPRMRGGCPEEEELGVGPSGLRGRWPSMARREEGWS